jgi:glucose/arabinose dehydrogenase
VAAALIACLVVWESHRPPDGEAIFRQRCATCHSTTDRAERAPGLGGVLGRRAGSGKGFGYTAALRDSGLVWDAITLDRFLTLPSALVPGTAMPMPVPDPAERHAVVAYLATLKAGGSEPVAMAAAANVGPFADYHGDSPGARHRITVADLPPPYATPSARNGPSVVGAPARAQPSVLPGFSVRLFASDLQNPRLLRVAPNGDLFVAESGAGRIRVLRAADGAGAPERVETFVDGLKQPFGIAFYPPGPDPAWMVVANLNSVVRFPYRAGDLEARGKPETLVARLTEKEGGHSTRDVAFAPDGKTMFVSVGSATNVHEGTTASASSGAAWEAAHGLGADWAEEAYRADVLAFDPDGGGERAFATGIRNCVGLAISPLTGDPWCATNERDGLGDNLVPDYVTHVQRGAFYGWPWYYLGDHEDPRHAGERPDLAGHVVVPDLLLQPHTAPLQLAFYSGAMFPAEYRGDAFVACHGSWNRSSRTGPKVVRALMKNGVATGEYEDFVTGFVVDDANVWGRPVGVAVAHDGALFVSDDAGGVIWRIAYGGPRL